MTEDTDVVGLTADIVAAYVSNNTVVQSDLPGLIDDVCLAVTKAAQQENQPQAEPLEPAVPIRRSVQPDYIVCLDDGKKFKSLKRHIRVAFGLTPDEYRQKWKLPYDYPMVAPNYSSARSALAKKIGLGRKRGR